MANHAIHPLPSDHFADHAVFVNGVLAGFILGPSPYASGFYVDNSVRPDLLPGPFGQAALHDTYASAAAFVASVVERRLAA